MSMVARRGATRWSEKAEKLRISYLETSEKRIGRSDIPQGVKGPPLHPIGCKLTADESAGLNNDDEPKY